MKIEEGKCPFCGSEERKYVEEEFVDGYFCRTYLCTDCRQEYNQWYELTFTGMTDHHGKTLGE